jgi:hypothetical protein
MLRIIIDQKTLQVATILLNPEFNSFEFKFNELEFQLNSNSNLTQSDFVELD